MKNLRCEPRSILFLMLFLSVATWVWSQEILILKDESETKPSDKPRPGVFSDEEAQISSQSFLLAYDYWREFEIAFVDGNAYGADKALREIVNLRARNAVPKITEMSLSLIRYGNLEFSRNRRDEALNLYQAAAAIDPSLSYAFYNQSKVYLARGVRGVLPAVQSSVRGLVAPLSVLSGKIHLYSKYLLVLTGTLVFLGAAFAVVLLVKYNKLFRHDVIEKRGAGRNPDIVHLFVWIFLFSPLLLWVGPLWLAPFWLMIFWKYARFAEKLFAFLFLIVFVLAYPVYRRVAQISAAATDPFVATYLNVFSEGASPKSIHDLEKYHEAQPKDSDATILLAYLYKTDGRIQPAAETLQKHILAYPNDARAYNNLAHTYFLQEGTDTALTLCQKAADLDSRNAIYRYNLSKLQRAKFNFSEAERMLEEARFLNPSLVQSLEGAPYERLVDDIPAHDLVWRRIEQRNGSFLSLLVNPFSGVAFGFLFLTMAMDILSVRKKNSARSCTKCGKAFCKKCQPGPREYGLCTQCLHIFVKKDGVSPISRKEKLQEIETYSRRHNVLLRFSSLLLPGSHALYRNYTFLGMGILTLWFLLLVLLFFNWKFAYLSFIEPPEGTGILTTLYVALLVLIFLITNLHQLKRSAV